MKTNRIVWIAPVLLLACDGLFAQSSVDSRVQNLEEAIQALERRVASLEEQLRERNARAAVPPDKVNWRNLQKGMSEGEVEKLLGSPSKVDAYVPFTLWNYASGGRVQFNGKTRKVEGWHEPN